MAEKKIKIIKDGPYSVSGNVPLRKESSIANEEGIPEKWEDKGEIKTAESYLLCRCGKSKTKPFCDQNHIEKHFDGREVAKKKFSESPAVYEGETLKLKDDESLCAVARFCDLGQGAWAATENSADLKSKELAIKEACNCPSGRLVLIDKKTGKVIEPKFAPSISITKDGELDGPIWVKGGVKIESADGKVYEKRNRVTLCRCGKSSNKPFCDGTHLQNFKKAHNI